eukprot:3489055-Rhodomonas_salina.1
MPCSLSAPGFEARGCHMSCALLLHAHIIAAPRAEHERRSLCQPASLLYVDKTRMSTSKLHQSAPICTNLRQAPASCPRQHAAHFNSVPQRIRCLLSRAVLPRPTLTLAFACLCRLPTARQDAQCLALTRACACRVSGVGCRVSGVGCRVSGSGARQDEQ